MNIKRYDASPAETGRVSSAMVKDPFTGQMQDLLMGGPGTRTEGLPQLTQDNDDANRARAEQEAAMLWDPGQKRFRRPPRSDIEATAMSAFMAQEQERQNRAEHERKQRLLRVMMGQMGGLR